MGISLERAKELSHLMNPKDRLVYGRPEYEMISPPSKADRNERREQAQFANWLLLQNSEGPRIPFVWHATHTRSKATPGTPDFLVGINAQWLSIEFKRDSSELLRPAQQAFLEACKAQGLAYYVVYTAQEAIELVHRHDSL